MVLYGVHTPYDSQLYMCTSTLVCSHTIYKDTHSNMQKFLHCLAISMGIQHFHPALAMAIATDAMAGQFYVHAHN